MSLVAWYLWSVLIAGLYGIVSPGKRRPREDPSMKVFDCQQNPIGWCKVDANRLIGTKFVMAIAVSDQRFGEVGFDICVYDHYFTGLIAETLDDARLLPGFTRETWSFKALPTLSILLARHEILYPAAKVFICCGVHGNWGKKWPMYPPVPQNQTTRPRIIVIIACAVWTKILTRFASRKINQLN